MSSISPHDPTATPELRELIDRVLSEAGEDGAERVALLERLLGPGPCRQLGIYRLPADLVLSVVIPVFNEVKTIGEVIERVRATDIPTEIVIVDDGSTDGTRQLLETRRGEEDLTVVFHDRNRGKGAALKTGFLKASGDIVVVQDADLEYDPADFRRLIQPIVEGDADVVFGSRFAGDLQRVLYFWHYVANRMLTMLSNVFTNLNLTDMETCYKVFRREVIRDIAPTLCEARFGIEPELTSKVAKWPGVRVYERPIKYSGRTYAQGKKITWRDGLAALWCILRYR